MGEAGSKLCCCKKLKTDSGAKYVDSKTQEGRNRKSNNSLNY